MTGARFARARRCMLVCGTIAALVLVAATTWVVGQTPDRLVERGRHTFTEQGCHGCHTVGKTGTPIATDLSRIGAKYGRPELEAWLRDPSAQRPTAHMPRIQLTGREVTALAAYLASLR